MAKRTPSEETVLRERACVELRREGMTWESIAAQVGYANPSGAQKAYQRAMTRIVYDDVMAERQLQQDRLDILFNAHWHKAIAGSIKHGMLVLKIMERRARLLGLDTPAKAEASPSVWDTALDDSISRELQEIYDRFTAAAEWDELNQSLGPATGAEEDS